MSTAKPKKTASKRPARAMASAPAVLTPDEDALLRCYRAMDQRGKDEALSIVEEDARAYPAIKCIAAPANIRLVAVAGTRVARLSP